MVIALPPLVSPAAELTNAEVARYSRHLLLPNFGVDGQKRLKNAKVLVIGAGGLGSPTLLYLAAAGVGTLGIVDDDVVDESNLQRQIIHGSSDVGRSKARSAAESIAELNPLVAVRLHETRLTTANAVELFAQYDLILDGTDNFATRYLVNDAAALTGKPYVWGSIYRFEGQVSVFWDAAPDGPDGQKQALNYRDLYPEPPPPGTVPSCEEGGVLGVLCASIAAVMGTEAIKLITGIGEPLLGRLMLYDALAMTYRTIRVRKDPAAPPITELGTYDDACEVPESVGASQVITAQQLRELLDSGVPVTLIDVREPVEWQINRLPGARLIPLAQLHDAAAGDELPRDSRVVLYCKTGVRSAQALELLQAAGFTDIAHVQGGIAGWAATVDPDLPMY